MVLVRRGLIGLAVAVVTLAVAIGCGQETITIGDCDEGETYHPIEERCVADEEVGSGGDGNDDGVDGGDDTGEDDGGDEGGEGGHEIEECGLGSIEGQTCRPDGSVLVGAEVTLSGVDCEDDEPFEMTTESDPNGRYSFSDVPAGTHEVTIESGSFTTARSVGVVAGETTELLSDNAKVCLDGGEVPIAVLEGSYDDVGALLDGMDIQYDAFPSGGVLGGEGAAGELLTDRDELMQYDILFLECGTLFDPLFGSFTASPGDVEANLRAFVEAGNSLYASDLAQPFVQEAFPEVVDFYREGDGYGGPQTGEVQDVTADVISDQMLSLLGADTTEITFSSPSWAVAADGGVDSTTHFTADVSISDDTEDTLEDSALMVTHDAPQAGAVIYTSFHNNDQATEDMEEILEYMIFQL